MQGFILEVFFILDGFLTTKPSQCLNISKNSQLYANQILSVISETHYIRVRYNEDLVHYPDICLEGLKKTKDYHSQHIRCPGPDSNQAPPEYESIALLLCQPVRYRQYMYREVSKGYTVSIFRVEE
jgi:hypothetical protein